ncbi:MAG: hypothetical protein WCJ57_04515 [Candidatus Falkowbacteria bacterium]
MTNFENKKNQQEEISNNQETLEKDPLNPENAWEDIKNEVENQGETAVNKSKSEVNTDFEGFLNASGSEAGPKAELEAIKMETEAKIVDQENIFNKEIEALDEQPDNKMEGAEGHLASVKSNYAESKSLEKELKDCKDPVKKFELEYRLKDKKESLEKSEAAYKNSLGEKVKEGFKNDPEMNSAKALKEIIIPGLSALEQEKLNALPPKEQNLVQKGMQVVGKYLPKGKWARTITVASVIAIASVALAPAATGSLSLYLGAKIGRSLAGSIVGEKVSEMVEHGMTKRSEKRQAENLEKINFSKEDINNSVNRLMELGETNLKDEKTQEKIKKYVKIGTHIAVAGATMAGLELAEMGIHSAVGKAAEAGAEASSHAAEASMKTLAAEAFLVSSKHAGMDLAVDKVVEKAVDLHLEDAA